MLLDHASVIYCNVDQSSAGGEGGRRCHEGCVGTSAADDTEPDRQTVDFGAGDADLRHAGQPAMSAQAQDTVALRTGG
jgi:hypothetical protein